MKPLFWWLVVAMCCCCCFFTTGALARVASGQPSYHEYNVRCPRPEDIHPCNCLEIGAAMEENFHEEPEEEEEEEQQEQMTSPKPLLQPIAEPLIANQRTEEAVMLDERFAAVTGNGSSLLTIDLLEMSSNNSNSNGSSTMTVGQQPTESSTLNASSNANTTAPPTRMTTRMGTRMTTMLTTRMSTGRMTTLGRRTGRQLDTRPQPHPDTIETVVFCKNIKHITVLMDAVKGFKGHRVNYFVLDSCKLPPFPNNMFKAMKVLWMEILNSSIQFHEGFFDCAKDCL